MLIIARNVPIVFIKCLQRHVIVDGIIIII